MGDIDFNIDRIWELVQVYGLKLIMAVVTLIVGLAIIKFLVNTFRNTMIKRNVDASLTPFLTSMLKALLQVALVITVATMIGIEMTSFIAVLGAAGLAVGLALQGSLQNFAGGVLILLLRPFKVGDYIVANGTGGSVREIQIFHTVLKTPDNVTIYMPNGPLANTEITNYSVEAQRRVDFVFGIGYGDDIDKARRIINEVIDADARFLSEPARQVVVSELADSSVNFTVRVWANASDYWGLKFDTTEKIKKEFDRQGINIPFPQRDVHIYQHTVPANGNGTSQEKPTVG
ncbi:mechanosensitive ion channel family protein [Catalinimonas alkaloidigena]|nr:mechanosensitive ion channel domain-containing protein [Catalinimonas alkaloidigena]